MAAADPNKKDIKATPAPSAQTAGTVNPAAEQFNAGQAEEPQRPINLLPDEFKPKKSVLAASKTLNRFAIGSLIIFLIIAGLGVASILLLNNRASAAKSEVEEVSAQVAALEQTEQQLILIKDRINKINTVRSSNLSLYDTVLVFNDFYSNIPSGLELKSVNIVSKQINTQILFGNSEDLARFLAQAVSADRYSIVKIENLVSEDDGRLNMSLVLAAI